MTWGDFIGIWFGGAFCGAAICLGILQTNHPPAQGMLVKVQYECTPEEPKS